MSHEINIEIYDMRYMRKSCYDRGAVQTYTLYSGAEHPPSLPLLPPLSSPWRTTSSAVRPRIHSYDNLPTIALDVRRSAATATHPTNFIRLRFDHQTAFGLSAFVHKQQTFWSYVAFRPRLAAIVFSTTSAREAAAQVRDCFTPVPVQIIFRKNNANNDGKFYVRRHLAANAGVMFCACTCVCWFVNNFLFDGRRRANLQKRQNTKPFHQRIEQIKSISIVDRNCISIFYDRIRFLLSPINR